MPCDGKVEEYCITEDDKHTCRICGFYHPLDGNDMVEAMNKMVGKGDWTDFFQDCWNIYVYTDADANYIHWLMQPARFFELMASWMKEKENENT